MTDSAYFRLVYNKAVEEGKTTPLPGVVPEFSKFTYRPRPNYLSLGKWRRVGVSGPWIQEMGGVS